jgi:uncharacterized protein YbcI
VQNGPMGIGDDVLGDIRPPESTTGTTLDDGDLREAINSLVVGVFAERTGRGPTKARCFLSSDVVVCLIEDALTRGERSLAASGREATVLQMRTEYQEAMREELVAGIEALTGRRVSAFLPGNSVEPDMASEVFVLDGRNGNKSDGGARQAVPAPLRRAPTLRYSERSS